MQLNPAIVFNLLSIGVNFLVFWRLNILSKTDLGETIDFIKYFSRGFLFFALYFLLITPVMFFGFSSEILGLFHWVGDALLYIAFSQSILSLILLVYPKGFSISEKIVYAGVLVFIFIPLYFYTQPQAIHRVFHELGLIISDNVPLVLNYLPFLLWFLTFSISGCYFVYKAMSLKDWFTRKRAFIISAANFLFVFGYPLSRLLYFLGLPIFSPTLSFFFGITGFYLLSFTSCFFGVYGILIKKAKVEKNNL